MTVSPPFASLSASYGRRLMWLFIGLALLITFISTNINQPLRTAAAPQGILSYEFAGDLATAQAIINSWDAPAKLRAAFGLGLDFLYPVVYGMAISLAVVAASGAFKGRLAQLGAWLAWGVWLAAALDYVENIALWQLLQGSSNALLPQIAWWCAAFKFLLLVLAILYALWGGIRGLLHRSQAQAADFAD